MLIPTAQAQWLEFTPCGRPTLDIENFDVPVEGFKKFSGPAPGLEVVWVWTPSIHAIVGYRMHKGEVICTALLVAGTQQLYVLGDVNSVVDRIKKAEEVNK